MPNHVSNTIRTQKVATLELLHKNSKDLEGGLAELLMPMPAVVRDNNGWYEWRTSSQNWGTKWGFYEQQFSTSAGEEGREYAQITFNTARDKPSFNLIHCLQEKFTDLEHWYECE